MRRTTVAPFWLGVLGIAGALSFAASGPARSAQDAPPSRDVKAGERRIDPSDIWRPPGYNITAVATRLDYPVDITFSDTGEVYVAETGGHTYGTVPMKAPPARIIQLMPDGRKRVVYDRIVPLEVIRKAEFGQTDSLPDGIIPPLTGVTWHNGRLYVGCRSRYFSIDPRGGDYREVVDGLPSWGEFLNHKPIFGPDGKMVFCLSTQGNSGVIEAHWLKVIDVFNKPGAREIPGEDVVLTGRNFPVVVGDPSVPSGTKSVMTGVYVPLGVQTRPGQVIPGQKICTGAFYKVNPDGTELERIAWGLRSCFGYRYSPDGRLFTTMNSGNPMEPRGIKFDWETVYEIVPNEWYGWPDFFSGLPVTDPVFELKPGEDGFVLTRETHRRLLKGKEYPRQPNARLPVHSAAEGMVFGRREFGIDPDHILVAEMGAIVPRFKGVQFPPREPPTLSPVHETFDAEYMWPGFRVQLVNPQSGMYTDFLINKTGRPASATAGGGLERPLQVDWGPDGNLYVVDFGVIEFHEDGMTAHPNTGVIWRVTPPPSAVIEAAETPRSGPAARTLGLREALPGPRPLEITITDRELTPATLSVRANEPLVIAVRNRAAAPMRFTLGLPGRDLRLQEPLAAGNVTIISMVAPRTPGRYPLEFRSAEKRLKGTLIVE